MLIKCRGVVVRLRLPFIALIALLTAVVFLDSVLAQTGPCTTDRNGSYTITVCITQPAASSVVSGPSTVATTVSFGDSSQRVSKLIFYLDGEYLLTDYEAPYTYVLPTATFANGPHTLSVQALLLNGYTTSSAAVTLNFSNADPPPPDTAFAPVTPDARPRGQSLIVAATGDGASGETNADLVSQMVDSWNPDVFLYLGDVYDRGTYTEFYNWYGQKDTHFGRLRDVTNPIVGNHEYEGGSASGYFAYWNNVPNYYSYNAGGWHFIALNSTGEFNQTATTSAQYQWLANDLNSNNSACSVAYFHHPVLSVGPEDDTPRMHALYNQLAHAGVDIILAGHDHNYQRWVPLDADFNPSPQGTTQFVAGVGGHGVRTIERTDSRLAAGFGSPSNSFGSLYFKLNPKGAEYRYINIQGQVLDQGVIPCSGTADTEAPLPPANLSVTTSESGHVALRWNATWDDTGVAGYNIYRNGDLIAVVAAAITSYTDMNVGLNITYDYQVDAVDLAGQRSAKSNTATITRPSQATLRFYPSADTYVQGDNPGANYGAATSLKVDAAPDMQSFLRFNLQGIDGTITRATLRLYANTTSGVGYQVHPLTTTGWTEPDTTYASRPAIGSPVAASGPFTATSWTEVDLRSLIEGSLIGGTGELEIALTTRGQTAVSFSSCEGANPPMLVITSSSNGDSSNGPAVSVEARALSGQFDQPPAIPAVAGDNGSGQRTCPFPIDPANPSFLRAAHTIFLPGVANE